MIALDDVVAWRPRVDPARRVIPAHLKLAILTRGRVALPSDRMEFFLDVARANKATWPDRMTGELRQLESAFPVTIELFVQRHPHMTTGEVSEAFAEYLVLRRRRYLLPACFLLVFTPMPASQRAALQAALALDIRALFRRANVSATTVDRKPDRWFLLTYVCFPPGLAALIAPRAAASAAVAPPEPLVDPMPPLEAFLGSRRYHLRVGAGEHHDSVGVVAGRVRAWATAKTKIGNEVWYRITLAEPTPVTKRENDDPATASILKGHRVVWVARNGVELLVAPWTLFRHQLRAYEAKHSSEPLARRIARLRRTLHPGNLPFDTVIGERQEGPYIEDLPYSDNAWQLSADYQAFLAPDGRRVDIQHLMVGLNALQYPEHPSRVAGLYVGTSWGASTWAGDIGAAAVEATLHLDRKTWESVHNRATEAERVTHYFVTRASDHDLLGDIDAWGIQAMRESDPAIDTIDGLISRYYDHTVPGGARTLTAARGDALERFLTHYGFEFDTDRDLARFPSLSEQGDSFESMVNECAAFAQIWMFKRLLDHGWSSRTWWQKLLPPPSDEYFKRRVEHTRDMTRQFLYWLESQAIEHGVRTAGP